MHVDISDFLIWLAVGAAGFFVRHLRSWNKWRKVRKMAIKEIRDPNGTDDPERAIVNAVDTIQRKRVYKETEKLARVLNGTGPHRKVG